MFPAPFAPAAAALLYPAALIAYTDIRLRALPRLARPRRAMRSAVRAEY